MEERERPEKFSFTYKVYSNFSIFANSIPKLTTLNSRMVKEIREDKKQLNFSFLGFSKFSFCERSFRRSKEGRCKQASKVCFSFWNFLVSSHALVLSSTSLGSCLPLSPFLLCL